MRGIDYYYSERRNIVSYQPIIEAEIWSMESAKREAFEANTAISASKNMPPKQISSSPSSRPLEQQLSLILFITPFCL